MSEQPTDLVIICWSQIKRWSSILKFQPTKKTFDNLYQLLLPKVRILKRWHGPSKVSSPAKQFDASTKKAGRLRKWNVKNEFLLTLMKLRLGLLNQDLGDRFHISATTVCKILTTWVAFLSANLVPALLFNSPKEAVELTLPKSFQTPVYCKVRHVIDCTEVFIEKRKDLQLQALTWSAQTTSTTRPLRFWYLFLPRDFSILFPKHGEEEQLTIMWPKTVDSWILLNHMTVWWLTKAFKYVRTCCK